VLDSQNTPYPVPVQRSIGGFQVRDLRLIPYPFFADVRGKGLNKDLALSAGIDSLTMGWASPVSFAAKEGSDVKSQVILASSDRSWAGKEQKVIPDFQLYPELGFPIVEEQKSYPLAILAEGKFSSFFEGKESPLLEKKPAPKEDEANSSSEENPDEKEKAVFSGVIDKSPGNSRLIVFASNEFLSDQTISIIGQVEATKAMVPLQIVQNALDWSLEDSGLLSIRSRGHFARTLMPLEDGRKKFIEYTNYFIALLGVLLIFAFLRLMRSSADVRYKQILQPEGA
jgi:ABC-2 type transport system permease protein